MKIKENLSETLRTARQFLTLQKFRTFKISLLVIIISATSIGFFSHIDPAWGMRKRERGGEDAPPVAPARRTLAANSATPEEQRGNEDAPPVAPARRTSAANSATPEEQRAAARIIARCRKVGMPSFFSATNSEGHKRELFVTADLDMDELAPHYQVTVQQNFSHKTSCRQCSDIWRAYLGNSETPIKPAAQYEVTLELSRAGRSEEEQSSGTVEQILHLVANTAIKKLVK